MAQKNDLSAVIMEKIEKEGIKIRSKYLVLAEKLGLGSSLVLSIIISALFVNLILYWLKSSQNLDFLSFGSLGFLAFLESFPYLWLVAVVVFLIIASLILKKYDISYQKPYTWLVLTILFLAFMVGGVVAVSGINEKLAQQVSKGRFFPLKPFYQKGYGLKKKNGIVGKIIKVEKSSLLVDVAGQSVKVIFDQQTRFPHGQDFHLGDWIRVVGKYQGNDFYAQGIGIMGKPFSSHRRGKGRSKLRNGFF